VNASNGNSRERRAAKKELIQRQIEQLENRLKQVNQRDAREARKRDTQLKIVAGAILLADVTAGKTDRKAVMEMFKRGAKRGQDVKLLQEEGWL
jgi:DNA-binding transcriptional regulator YbjK